MILAGYGGFIMRILYCDDDKRQLDIFYNNFIGITDDEIDICLPEEIDKKISGDAPPDIILMDLELEEAGNGIDLTAKIRKSNPETVFIYVTAYTEKFVQDAFLNSKNVAGFLVKPIQKEYFSKAIDKAKKILLKTRKTIHITPIKGGYTALNEDEILYIESTAHNATYFTDEEEYTVVGKLSDILKILSRSFEQCHKSFIVNMDRVKSIEPKSVIMDTGKNIPLSYNKRENFKIKYMEYFRFLKEEHDDE